MGIEADFKDHTSFQSRLILILIISVKDETFFFVLYIMLNYSYICHVVIAVCFTF